MNHFEAVLPQTRFTFNPQVPNSTPKPQSFDHLVSDSGSKDMPVYDDYGDSAGNGQFHDVLSGFGNNARSKPESRWSFKSIGKTSKTSQDSNAVFTSTSPHVASGSRKANGTSVSSDGARSLGDLDPFGSFGKSMSSFSSLKTDTGKEGSPMRTHGTSEHPTYSSKETAERFSWRSPGGQSGRKLSSENNYGSPRSFFKMPSVFTNSRKSSRQDASSPTSGQVKSSDKSAHVDTPPWSQKIVESSDDVWLTVSDVPLFTQPTRAPPPSRPPPPPPVPFSKTIGSSVGSSSDTKIQKFSSSWDLNGHSEDHNSVPITAKSSTILGVDESGRVALGQSRSTSNDIPWDEVGMRLYTTASAATAKEAMDRAETKFQHAKGMRERESKDSAVVEKEGSRQDAEEKSSCREQERLEQGQKDKEEGEQWKLEKERERKEKENEQRRLENERERARQAVERATREARERAAAEAGLKAEKAAREKANAEARRLAERAAVQRAQAEARERAAALAKERAEKAAAEAREQEAREKALDAQIKAEKASVERAAAEAQNKAAAEVRERVVAVAKAPKFSSKQSAEVAKASAATVSRLREASLVANSVDDLYSVFDGLASDREFEDESEQRRRARLEQQQRTQERAARALAEKNQRDLQAQREQEERQRIGETLDTEIKRWAAGKEGNLRALLATLQYVLWPECGWQPVSLTDLMTGASVKKVYRKATLCIHPDKVQQKGANLQQKYIAEKVFDLLKEAWNKFNSEELF